MPPSTAAPPARPNWTSSIRFALTLCLLLLLGSCAAIGTVPGVSLLYDLFDVKSMMERMETGELTEVEAKDLAERPLPIPPGLSFEVAALRRMAGHMVLGNYAGAAEARDLVRRHGQNPEVLLMATIASAQAMQLDGRYRAALAEFQRYERDTKARRKVVGSMLIGNEQDFMAFASFLDAGMQAGQFQEVERVLAEFFGPSGNATSAKPALQREIGFTARRTRARLLVARGNAPGGLEQVRQLLQE
jgi:hypothetical protein